MKKNLTKKLMLSVLTLAFAVVSLGASTFAWFTMSSNAKVSAFEGAVKGAEGVEIAITKLGWDGTPGAADEVKYDSLKWFSGQLPADQFTNDIIDSGFAFSALTSNGKGTFTDVNNTTVDASHANAGKASGGYIGFRLWFKSANTASGETLNLTNIAITNSGTINKYTVDQQFTVSAPNSSDAQEEALVGSKWKFDVTSAARVSLHPQDSAHPDQTDKLPFVFEANESDTVIDAEVGVAGNSTGYKDKDGAWEYYNAKVQNTADQLKTAPAGPVCKQIGSVKNTKTESLPIITLTANTPTYVDVYVWIEGWDGECLNAIFTQALSVNFDFALSSSYNA